MRQLFCKRLLFALGFLVSFLVGFGALTVVVAQPGGTGQADVEEESPLLKEPETPEEIFDSTILMLDLARPNLARRYLEKFLETEPGDELLLNLRERHGPGVFIRFATVLELREISAPLLERVNRIFREHATDPQQIDSLVADLSGAPRQRELAVLSLRDAGPVVIPRLLHHLQTAEEPRQRDLLVHTISRLGKQNLPPLIAALGTADEALKTAVIDILGWIGSRDAAPHLWHPAFAESQHPGVRLAARQALERILDAASETVAGTSSGQAAETLQELALRHFRYEAPLETALDYGAAVPVWTWDNQTETLTRNELSPRAASLDKGRRLARQALEIRPGDRELQGLTMALSLAAEYQQSGDARRLPTGPGTAHDLALTIGADVITVSLRQALENTNAEAAVAALRVLGQIATRHQLYRTAAEDSPLTAALNYPDRRVQFAAAHAILQLDPNHPFPASSRVVAILSRALLDEGTSGALVVHGNLSRGSMIAAMAGDAGYQAEPVTTGRQAFQIAGHRSDVELILLSANTADWPLTQTVANLRADARTAAIPIVIFGPENVRMRVGHLTGNDASTVFVEEPTSSDYLEVQVRPFLQKLKSAPLSGDERAARRSAAAFWLGHIAGGRRTDVFDLRPAEAAVTELLSDPDLAENALAVLAAIPTVSAQKQLQMTVVSNAYDVGVRERAALQLAFHIQKHGALLSAFQVNEIQTLHTATDSADLATALASVIGSLKPNTPRVGSLLRSGNRP